MNKRTDDDGASSTSLGRSAPEPSSRDGRLRSLLTQSGGGDQQAFAGLYEEIAPVVYGIAVRVLRDHNLAAETAQDVLLEIWKSAARFDASKGTVMGWVSTISHRRAVDSVRAVEAQRQRDSAAGARDAAPAQENVEDTVVAADEAASVRRCFETLTAGERDVVNEAYYSGKTYRQVAEETRTPLGTVKSRMRLALKHLAKCLGVER